MQKRRTAEEIAKLLASYRQRGEMTRRQFCEAQGISMSMLDYYLRRYGESTATLVRVQLQSAEKDQEGGRFSLVLENGRRIECGEAGLPTLLRIAEAN